MVDGVAPAGPLLRAGARAGRGRVGAGGARGARATGAGRGGPEGAQGRRAGGLLPGGPRPGGGAATARVVGRARGLGHPVAATVLRQVEDEVGVDAGGSGQAGTGRFGCLRPARAPPEPPCRARRDLVVGWRRRLQRPRGAAGNAVEACGSVLPRTPWARELRSCGLSIHGAAAAACTGRPCTGRPCTAPSGCGQRSGLQRPRNLWGAPGSGAQCWGRAIPRVGLDARSCPGAP